MHLARPLFVATVLAALTPVAMAGEAPAITAGERSEVIATLGKQLDSQYVFPDVAAKLGKAIADKNAAGGYAKAATAPAFAAMLSKDLSTFGNDLHLRANFDPNFQPEPDDDAAPTAEQLAGWRDEAAKRAWGIYRTERLPGNVGYLDLRGFGPAEVVGPAFTQAISLLSGTDALILDLRRNGGGEPASVAYLLSHFFPLGDNRHLNDIYTRPKNSTREYWTVPSVTVRYAKPVYVLTSAYTFSGGEECAYDFQTQKRATLVGETTGGGANPGQDVSLGHGVVAFIPTGRAINPITHTNWEHVGVKPDVAVPATQALQRAYADILRGKVAAAKEPEEKDELGKLLARVEKGENVTEFTPPRHP